LRASLRVHDDAETPSMISLKHASTIAEIRILPIVSKAKCFCHHIARDDAARHGV
jgi:hypothetical protein